MAAFTTTTKLSISGCAMPFAAQRSLVKPFARPSLLQSSRAAQVQCQAQGGGATMSSQIKTAESLSGESLTCMRQDDGSLLIEGLRPGRYTVSAAPPSATGKAFCSLSNPDKCVTYCTLDDEWNLVCEGLPEGVYDVRPAGDRDVHSMVEHIWGLMTYAEEGADTDADEDDGRA